MELRPIWQDGCRNRSQFEIAQLIGTQGVTIRLRIAKLLSAIHSSTFSRGVNFTTLL